MQPSGSPKDRDDAVDEGALGGWKLLMTATYAPTEHWAPAHSFAAGWNAACDGRDYELNESVDWKIGWAGAMRLEPREREKYRFNAPVKPFRYWK